MHDRKGGGMAAALHGTRFARARCLLPALLALFFLSTIPITVEHASQPETLAWGLMGRTSLPENHGMVLHLNNQATSLWSFNCQMDLSVAFIAADGTILQIEELKSYPEKMDPERPVRSLSDLVLYPTNDPIRTFFREHAVHAKQRVPYALEMPAGWFKRNGVQAGDLVLFDSCFKATIERASSAGGKPQRRS